MKARTRIAAVVAGGALFAVSVALVGRRSADGGHRAAVDPARSPPPRVAAALVAPVSSLQPPQHPNPAALPPSTECTGGFVPAGAGLCRPVNLGTGHPYSDEELARYDEMRKSPFVAKANFLAPRVMTAAEATRQAATFVRENELADRVSAGSATEAEIEEYFHFRARQTEYRLQLIAYRHAASGGSINRHDPVLELEAITDPELRRRYAAVTAERNADDQKHALARERIGLAGHIYAALP